ncbi:alpha-ketoglutarate-dependent dioxygenase AlkB family protein [Dyadobacter pollutisoli]|uniref:Alpha-ketoglutarate-dependent dioxygenase AlkB n=1 Tax=Dyadobacter pollutisoli TaxID=2910158 RepID=A0A9E8SRU7_9BACT|nr:alpha-ketoglutarate-dependent dioxygenase AlkB [Dyadobacter pollutisoli]WAC14597.1 alpha-ketoglutarate-dependent dioxygenase AlkB [Dyadobacter pollutisoli]
MEQFKLFDDREHLLLPEHLMEYKHGFFDRKESDRYLNTFLETITWQQTKVMMYDKEVLTPRLCAWFGDRPIRQDDKRPPIPWTDELWEIKTKVEDYTGIIFNGVLLNYYRDGNDSVAWHSDKDTIVGLKTEIASVSFGQARNFDFRNKENHRQQYSLELGNGSLLLMKGDLQKYWEHRIAKSAVPMKARINLTFRKVL